MTLGQMRSERGSNYRRRGAMLLEVIVALTILTIALGMLGTQLVNGLRMTGMADEDARATQLADRMMATLEMDPNAVMKLGDEGEIFDEFGDAFPGWFWRVRLNTTDLEGLGEVTLAVMRDTDPEQQYEIEKARVVREFHMLKAAPATIDMERDFGVPQDQLALLTETLPLPGLDPANFNPQALAAALTPDTLMELLPVLMPLLSQLGGGQLPGGLSPDMLQQLLSGGAIPGVGNLPLDQLPAGMLDSLLGGMGGGRGAAGGGPPGRGGARGGSGERLPGRAGSRGGNSQDDAIRELIRQQLGDQLSDDQIDAMLSGIGNDNP